MFAMSTDAKWTLGTGVALLAVVLAVFTLLIGRFDSMEARLVGIESRINVMENRLDARLLSIEEHLRAAPAAALPEHPLTIVYDKGVYHKMSPKHLHRYIDGFTGRHNIRNLDTIQQVMLVALNMVGKRLRYKDLVAD